MDAMDFVNAVGTKQAEVDRLEKLLLWQVRKLGRLAKVADSYANLKLPMEKATTVMMDQFFILHHIYVQLRIEVSKPIPRFKPGAYVVGEVNRGGEKYEEINRAIRQLRLPE